MHVWGAPSQETAVNKPILFDQSLSIANSLGQLDVLRIMRGITFVVTLLLVWVSLHPFPDLGDAGIINDREGGRLAATYITLGLLSLTAFALTVQRNLKAFRTLITPTFMIFVGWMCINTLFSQDFGISAQRLLLTAYVMALAASLVLLPETQADLDRWLSAAALILLGLCYLGIELAPTLSMHMSRDILEPHLAGNWRGTFGHKNAAAPIMAMLVFVGLYLVSRRAIVSGLAIGILAGTFLTFSGGKSATALCVLALLLSYPIAAAKSLLVRASLCFLPLIAINVLSVGSVYNESLAAIVKILPLDSSFTGRTEIWEFAIASLNLRPLLGYGFAAFWGTDAIENLVLNDQIEWATTAAHSHNGYLDTALTIGYPGLALMAAIFVFAPLRNFSVAIQSGNDGRLARLFMRIWLFCIYLSSMESFFLDRADAIWFTFLIAVFGLHFISRFRMVSELTGR